MIQSCFILITLAAMTVGPLPHALASTRLNARIVDDATGSPLAARVAATSSDGKFLEIDGPHAHVQYLNRRWCYVNESFSLPVPAGGVTLELRRGLETRPYSATIAGDSTGGGISKTFRLRRWIDMRSSGYFNGDIHAHIPAPQEAHLQMLAEDLNALTLLHVSGAGSPLPLSRYFTGTIDEHSTPGCEIFISQEIQDWQMGHLTLLGLRKLIPGYPEMGGSLEYWKSFPHWDLGRAMRAAHEQMGMVFWSHFCSLPGAQSAIGIALGLVDGIELVTWNDPTQFPNHWGPWLNSGMSQAEFPVMRAMDLYYQFLNAGFRLPIAAGTDKFAEDIPLGSNRTYARVKAPGSYAEWLAGIKAGNGFVSNGPILDFEAGARAPGDVVEFQGAKEVKARVTARSILPFTTLEIVLNGEIVGHKTRAIPQNPPVDGIYSMEVEAGVTLRGSGWLAARVVDHPDLRNRILPRDVSVFAHTNPIYFLQDGRRVRQEASIAYLRKYVEGVLHWLASNPAFTNEEDRRSAKEEAEAALRIYRGL